MERQKILIVEDDADISGLLVKIMEGAGYQVRQAFSGTEALFCMERELPDCVLLDLMLPGMDGTEAIKEVRNTEQLKYVPIMLLTAKEKELDKVVGLDCGADDYMVKPIDLDELFLRIGALLRRYKIASSRRLEVGNFTMDADEHTAYLGDEEIQLTMREFNLLYKLLSYPKKTFTRQQLMDEFWNADTETAPRAVDVYMTKLRSKLIDCDSFEIVTVHGLGYKAVLK